MAERTKKRQNDLKAEILKNLHINVGDFILKNPPKRFPREFYENNDTLFVAQSLIHSLLWTKIGDNQVTVGRISEVEAYLTGSGISENEDTASHANSLKPTKRTFALFEQGGTAYVYTCYGVHTLMNISVQKKSIPHCVLIRAVCPLVGIETMILRRDLSSSTKLVKKKPRKKKRRFTQTDFDEDEKDDMDFNYQYDHDYLNIPVQETGDDDFQPRSNEDSETNLEYAKKRCLTRSSGPNHILSTESSNTNHLLESETSKESIEKKNSTYNIIDSYRYKSNPRSESDDLLKYKQNTEKMNSHLAALEAKKPRKRGRKRKDEALIEAQNLYLKNEIDLEHSTVPDYVSSMVNCEITSQDYVIVKRNANETTADRVLSSCDLIDSTVLPSNTIKHQSPKTFSKAIRASDKRVSQNAVKSLLESASSLPFTSTENSDTATKTHFNNCINPSGTLNSEEFLRYEFCKESKKEQPIFELPEEPYIKNESLLHDPVDLVEASGINNSSCYISTNSSKTTHSIVEPEWKLPLTSSSSAMYLDANTLLERSVSNQPERRDENFIDASNTISNTSTLKDPHYDGSGNSLKGESQASKTQSILKTHQEDPYTDTCFLNDDMSISNDKHTENFIIEFSENPEINAQKNSETCQVSTNNTSSEKRLGYSEVNSTPNGSVTESGTLQLPENSTNFDATDKNLLISAPASKLDDDVIRQPSIVNSLCRGPGCLCQCFGITKEFNNLDTVISDNLYITEPVDFPKLLEYIKSQDCFKEIEDNTLIHYLEVYWGIYDNNKHIKVTKRSMRIGIGSSASSQLLFRFFIYKDTSVTKSPFNRQSIPAEDFIDSNNNVYAQPYKNQI